jgi:hypothetical protein
MATKNPNARNKRAAPTKPRSAVLSAIIGTVLNMAATTATFGSVLSFLLVATRFI